MHCTFFLNNFNEENMYSHIHNGSWSWKSIVFGHENLLSYIPNGSWKWLWAVLVVVAVVVLVQCQQQQLHHLETLLAKFVSSIYDRPSTTTKRCRPTRLVIWKTIFTFVLFRLWCCNQRMRFPWFMTDSMLDWCSYYFHSIVDAMV